VKSRTTSKFWIGFADLPDDIKDKARSAYRLWLQQHDHPSLRFKQVRGRKGVYSVRITESWRALGVLRGDTIYWHWIGPHDVYMRLISN
jgi:hypothetical protein